MQTFYIFISQTIRFHKNIVAQSKNATKKFIQGSILTSKTKLN